MSGAPRLRVFIATTSGPVEIQRITEEDPEIDSVVCLAGKAMPLPISAGYHNFVRQPTGVVQRLFGHGSYRVDLSGTVEDGYSWQLGMLLGHAAVATGRFAGGADGKDTGHAVFATGEVKVDLEILPVGHVAAKLDRLAPMVRELADAGSGVTVIVPASNRTEVDEARFAAAGLGPDRCRIVYAATGSEALAAVGLEAALALRPARAPVPARSVAFVDLSVPWGKGIRAAVGAAAAVAILGLAAWSAAAVLFADWRALVRDGKLAALDEVLSAALQAGGVDRFRARLYESWLERSRPADNAVDLRVVEYRAPEGKSCAAVRFGAAEASARTIGKQTARSVAPARFEGLCALEIVAEATSDAVYLWGRYERRLAGSGGAADDTVVLGPSRGALRWKVDLPRRLHEAFDLRVVVAAARQPVDGASGWLAETIPPPGPPEDAQTWYARARRLNARGVTLLDTAYRLSP